jgi:sugar phosphate isomerase/epimerase
VKVGAHSWLLETRYPLSTAMRRAAEIGYDGYELDIGNFGGTGLGLQILPDRLQETNREELRRYSSEAGIPYSSLCLGALWHYPIAAPDEARRLRGIEIIRAAIPLAAELGAGCILLPLDQPEGITDAEAYAMTLASLEPCVTLAEEHGVVLGIENVCIPFLLGAEELGRLVDDIDSVACRVYYDVGNNTLLGRDPAAEIRDLGDRIVQFHFKNESSPRGTPGSRQVSINRPGIVPYGEVMDAIASIGFNGYLVVEVPTLGEDADLVARENHDALRELLASM